MQQQYILLKRLQLKSNRSIAENTANIWKDSTRDLMHPDRSQKTSILFFPTRSSSNSRLLLDNGKRMKRTPRRIRPEPKRRRARPLSSLKSLRPEQRPKRIKVRDRRLKPSLRSREQSSWT